MDKIKLASDALALAGLLLSKGEGIVKSGGGIVVEAEALAALLLSDADVKAAISALVSDIKAL